MLSGGLHPVLLLHDDEHGGALIDALARHGNWGRVWEVDYDWLQSRFDSKKIMETSGIPLTRW